MRRRRRTQRHEKQYSISDKASNYWHEPIVKGMIIEFEEFESLFEMTSNDLFS